MKRIIILMAIVSLAKAQDTIRFRNGDIKAVKVSEVGMNEIKYNRFDNLTGPTYISPKNDVLLIKYAGGYVDSFKVVTQPLVVNPEKKVAEQNVSGYPATNEKIVIRGTDLFYTGRPLGEAKLKKLVSQFPDQNKRLELYREFEVMRAYKKKQMLYFFGGLGAGLAIPYAGLIGAVFSDDGTPLLIALPIGVGIGVTGVIMSAKQKKKKLEQRAKVAQMYNDLLSN